MLDVFLKLFSFLCFHFVFIPDLDAGWYTVTETFVPNRYILDSTPHDVLLEEWASGDGKAYYTLRLENERTPERCV